METDHGRVARMELGDRVDLAWTRGGDAGVRFPAPAGEVASDGRLGLVRCEGERLAGFSFQDGTRLEAGGVAIFTASEPVDASLRLAPERVSGFLRGPDSGYKWPCPWPARWRGSPSAGDCSARAWRGMSSPSKLAGEGTPGNLGRENVLEDLAEYAEAPGAFRLLAELPQSLQRRHDHPLRGWPSRGPGG